MATADAQVLGRWRFHYAVLPYAERWAAVAQAHFFNTPPLVVSMMAGIGPPSLLRLCLAAEPAGFLITAIRLAANSGSGLRLRGFDATEEPS